VFVVPDDPRFGMTNACITQRSDLESVLTVSIVAAASAIGRGFFVSGELGTTESTAAEVHESRKTSFQ
jgi:hypothetical protein